MAELIETDMPEACCVTAQRSAERSVSIRNDGQPGTAGDGIGDLCQSLLIRVNVIGKLRCPQAGQAFVEAGGSPLFPPQPDAESAPAEAVQHSTWLGQQREMAYLMPVFPEPADDLSEVA